MLPTIVVPEYEVKLFSQTKPTKFRPYLVREEKLFMMAQHGEDPKEIENAVKQIIRNCTFNKVNPDTLPSFDLEMMFLQLRSKSVNNVIDAKFVCQKLNADGKECGGLVPVAIDINDIKLTVPEGHTNKIWLTDDIGVVMKYPTAEMTGTDLSTVLPQCLESVFTKDGAVFEIQNTAPAEVAAFVESLTIPQVEKIRVFFDTMPILQHTFIFECPKCHYTDDVTLRGLMSFFD